MSNLFFKNTKYHNSILVEIRVCCYMYKRAHGANLLICTEFFVICKSIVSLVLHEFVIALNIVFKKLTIWPIGV